MDLYNRVRWFVERLVQYYSSEQVAHPGQQDGRIDAFQMCEKPRDSQPVQQRLECQQWQHCHAQDDVLPRLRTGGLFPSLPHDACGDEHACPL